MWYKYKEECHCERSETMTLIILTNTIDIIGNKNFPQAVRPELLEGSVFWTWFDKLTTNGTHIMLIPIMSNNLVKKRLAWKTSFHIFL
jgi:hypothetical protein